MKKLLLLALMIVSGSAVAQNVGIGTANPDESAILDLKSSNKGFLLPRLTEKQKALIPQPAEGLMIYQTDSNQGVYLYQSGSWKNMGSANVTTTTSGTAAANIATAYTTNYLLVGDGTSTPISSPIFVNFTYGFLGLGTNIPENMIHAKKDRGGLIKLEGTDNLSTVFYTAKNSTGDEFQVGIAGSGYSNSNYPGIAPRGGYFYSANNLGLIADNNSSIIFQTGGLERLRLLNNGFLGLGTSVPENMVHAKKDRGGLIKIEGTNNLSTVFYTAKNSTGDEFQVGIAGSGYSNSNYPGITARGGYFYSANNLGLIADNNSSIIFQTGGLERLRLLNNGFLGLGTSVPENMVHAKKDRGGLIKIEGTDNLSTVFYTAKNSTGDEFQVGIAGSSYSNSNYPGITARGGYFYSANNLGLIADNNSNIIFQTGNLERVKVNQSGALAIGDFFGSSPLRIPDGYRLVVQDGIITEKVKVALRNSQNDWADYVFDSNYQLMPLQEVENFIKVNKHLPNVPSADEMVEQGVDVAKTSKMFMEKIEELTLYIIQLKKEIEILKNQTK